MIRSELNSLQALSRASAVRDLANLIVERQEQHDSKREIESRRLMEFQMELRELELQQGVQRAAEAGKTATSCRV
jgi:hypothetical protein